jgi:hypothetical protein
MITKVTKVQQTKGKISRLSEVKDNTIFIYNYKRWREACERVAKVLSDRKDDS